ncbi:hypothetical protein ABIB40_002095 [Pedobacter sp. UYP30]|uniref:PKD-like domain-containing protein n=1 Tax=Pedobacter sp. UYP30 TaxID=1756400 RepID=UPI00339A6ED3
MNRLITLLLLGGIFITSCKKDHGFLPPNVSLTNQADSVTAKINVAQTFNIDVKTDKDLTQEWVLDGKKVGNGNSYDFTAANAGSYLLTYKATNAGGVFTHSYKIIVEVPVIAIKAASSKFISKVFDYQPAPGQGINETVGSPEQAQKLIGGTNSFVTLGAFGGFIIFGFDHSVVNNTGYDLGIYGNPFGPPYDFSEPGVVMVSQDANGNGLADDEWYELAGSEYAKATTIKNYEITYTNPKAFADVPWTDNQGKSGVVKINNFHKHNFYPEFADNQEKLTFKGTLLPSTVSSSGFTTSKPFDFGYTDSYSLGDDFKTNGFNSFDISRAVNKEGKKVVLKTIDFVKVYTGQNANAGFLGEISTEVKGAVDLGIK